VGHALRKRPATGDYRVQEEWGGTAERAEPTTGLADLATRVCEILPASSLYARIDIVSIAGRWHIMEVEVTEPSLWLELAPDTTRMLAAAIGARVSRS
jgi:glutathione synthase/RimK-type ligase-like ATP-grasp enzyme